MRILVYNIAYGTGCPEGFLLPKRLWTVHRYLRTSQSHLDRIIEFIDGSGADVVGLVEVDTGSFRTNFVNQVETVANHLSRYHHCAVKYGKGLGRMIPILRRQANAVLTRRKVPKSHFHFFPSGFKKLVIELDIEGVSFFLVHLALQRRIRELQLEHLAELVDNDKPTIVAGDFNTFDGPKELEGFQLRTGLVNPNVEGLCTYPSWDPKRQLDFVLCSKGIKVLNFEVPEVRYSDHLPIILDFRV